MKRNIKTTALIALLLIVLVPVILVLVNKQKASRLDKLYIELKGTIKSGHYTITELKIPGKVLVLQSADRGNDADSVTQSYLRYDRLRKLLIITSEEPAPQENGEPNSDKIVHQSFFDLNGAKVDQKRRLYNADTTGLENTVLLKDRIRPFQHWKDARREIYLNHFGIKHFELSSLNPLQLGSINGGSPVYAWSGTGYYDLKMQQETLKLKFPAEKEQVFFTEKNSYHTGLKLFDIMSDENGENIKLIVHLSEAGSATAFLIWKD